MYLWTVMYARVTYERNVCGYNISIADDLADFTPAQVAKN
jgi:hypothetical protein